MKALIGEILATKKIYSINSKIFLFVALAFVFAILLNLLLTHWVKQNLIKKAEADFLKKGETYCSIVVSGSEKAITNRGLSQGGALHDLVLSIFDSGVSDKRGAKSDIKYIKVFDDNNVILMDSDYARVGDKAIDSLTKTASKAYQFGYKKYQDKRGEDVYDFFMPILQASTTKNISKLGFVRVGLTMPLSSGIYSIISRYVVLSTIVLILSAVIAIALLKRISEPITGFIETANEVVKGDLTKTIDITSQDEIQVLAEIFNQLSNDFKVFVLNIDNVSKGMGNVNKNISSNSEHILKGSKKQSELIERAQALIENINVSVKGVFKNLEHLSGFTRENLIVSNDMSKKSVLITNGIDNLNMYIHNALSPIEDVFSSLESVSKNVIKLSETANKAASFLSSINMTLPKIESSAREAALLSENFTKSAEDLGLTSIQDSIEGMQRIKSSVRKATEVVDRLGNRSMEVGKILTVINEIAEQTNLLALNAAILASEAGEYGKGFDVVANEIRELSEKTAISTKEIDKLITTVLSEVNEAIDVMNQSSQYVDEGERLSNDTYRALSGILETSAESSTIARLIEEDTSMQIEGIQQLTVLIAAILDNTKSIKAATEEQKEKGKSITADAAKLLKSKAKEIQTTIAEQTISTKKISSAISDYSQMIDNILGSMLQHAEGNENVSNVIREINQISSENLEIAENLSDISKEAVKETDEIGGELAKLKVVSDEDDDQEF